MSTFSRRRINLAGYIGKGVIDPVGWTQVAPQTAAPAGQQYITDGGTPLRYKIDASGNYLTKAA